MELGVIKLENGINGYAPGTHVNFLPLLAGKIETLKPDNPS
jgi:hypothetical protein